MGYEITRYRPELRPGVIELQRHLVSADPALNDAYFRWKHEQNPYTDGPIVYVAVIDGRVAGMRAFLGARWRLADNDGTASWLCACDLVVDPAHRSQKLFKRIQDVALPDLAERGFGPVLNWSANPITYGASVRSGWRLVAPYLSWARQTPSIRRARALPARMRRWPIAWRYVDVPARLTLRPGFAAMDAAWSRARHDPALAFEHEPRPDSMAALAQRSQARLAGHERDATYFRWRFDNPLSDYRYVFWNEPGLEGFLILQLRPLGDAADIGIVDWEASRPELFEAMLAPIAATGGYDSLSVWSATLPEAIRATLRQLHFEPLDTSRGDPAYRPGPLAIGAAGSDIGAIDPAHAPYFRDLSRWDLRMVYSDFY